MRTFPNGRQKKWKTGKNSANPNLFYIPLVHPHIEVLRSAVDWSLMQSICTHMYMRLCNIFPLLFSWFAFYLFVWCFAKDKALGHLLLCKKWEAGCVNTQIYSQYVSESTSFGFTIFCGKIPHWTSVSPFELHLNNQGLFKVLYDGFSVDIQYNFVSVW